MTDSEPEPAPRRPCEHSEPEPAPTRPCEHCAGGPDTVLVRKRVTAYEHHRPDCRRLTVTIDHCGE